MASKGVVGTVNFDVKTKLEEKERKSQMSVIGFSLFLSTKPSIVKFQVDGTATLTGKDADIQKMLEVDPETKMPLLFQRVYQSAFTAMYLMSTILNTPPPPNDLLHSDKQASPVEGVSVEVGTEDTEDGVTVEAVTEPEERTEAVAPRKQSSQQDLIV
jgi:hypothetical protein